MPFDATPYPHSPLEPEVFPDIASPPASSPTVRPDPVLRILIEARRWIETDFTHGPVEGHCALQAIAHAAGVVNWRNNHLFRHHHSSYSEPEDIFRWNDGSTKKTVLAAFDSAINTHRNRPFLWPFVYGRRRERLIVQCHAEILDQILTEG